MNKAIAKIKQAIQLQPHDDYNWVVWGLILRKVGSYQIALHKFMHALKLNPNNKTAKSEVILTQKIMQLDAQVSVEDITYMKRIKPNPQFTQQLGRPAGTRIPEDW